MGKTPKEQLRHIHISRNVFKMLLTPLEMLLLASYCYLVSLLHYRIWVPAKRGPSNGAHISISQGPILLFIGVSKRTF